jgi:hypothetical protein
VNPKQRLLDALTLMTYLKPFVDFSNTNSQAFNDAWNKIREEAKQAAQEYVKES